MHQRAWHLDTACKSYKGSKFFLVEVMELFLQHTTYVCIDFRDIHKVMMAVLGEVRFRMYPP